MTTGVLDQQQDANLRDFSTFSKVYAFPEYVKQASVPDVFGTDDLTPAQYADPTSKRFPVHTKSATFVSYLYFLENRNELATKKAGYIAERLDKSAAYWGISGEISAAKEKHASRHTSLDDQLPDHKFAYVWVGEDGTKERRYPLRNSAETAKAASYLRKHRDHWSFDDRHVMAKKILRSVDEYGVKLASEDSIFLERQAGHGIGMRSRIVKLLEGRVKRAEGQESLKKSLAGLANQVAGATTITQNPGMMCKIASVVDQFDRECALTHHYCDSFPRPEEVIFEHTLGEMQKTAAAVCELQNGSIFTVGSLERLRPQQVRDLFGTEATNEVVDGFRVNGVKLAEFASALPAVEADLLEMALEEVSVEPAVRKEATQRLGLADSELEELAELYKKAYAS